ncbi:MAG: hypothetical protein ACK5K7_06715 [Bacilli bacterium]
MNRYVVIKIKNDVVTLESATTNEVLSIKNEFTSNVMIGDVIFLEMEDI